MTKVWLLSQKNVTLISFYIIKAKEVWNRHAIFFIIAVHISNELLWPVLFSNIFQQEILQGRQKTGRKKNMTRSGWDMSEGQACCQQKLLYRRSISIRCLLDKNFCKNMIIQASPPRQCIRIALHFVVLLPSPALIWFWLWCPEVFSCKRGVLGGFGAQSVPSQCLVSPKSSLCLSKAPTKGAS